MATAPRPGASRGNSTAKRWRITLEGRTLEFPVAVTLAEKWAVRTATGFPLEAFLPSETGHVGEDSVAVLWWLARRANGEPRLPWAQAMLDWPTDLDPGQLDVEIEDDDGEPTDDPGKSVPA